MLRDARGLTPGVVRPKYIELVEGDADLVSNQRQLGLQDRAEISSRVLRGDVRRQFTRRAVAVVLTATSGGRGRRPLCTTPASTLAVAVVVSVVGSCLLDCAACAL